MASENENKFYWCMKHHTVEPYQGCSNDNRLGPYDTREQAAGALEHVAERNEDWDNDPRFNDPDDEDD